MATKRDEYIKLCKEFVETFSADKKVLIQYVRDKKWKPKGVVVAYRHPRSGEVNIGWSLCNTKVEKYNKYIGLNKAINRAVPVQDAAIPVGCMQLGKETIPHSIGNVFNSMLAQVHKTM